MYGHHQYTILGPPPYTSCLPSPYTHSPECLQRLQDGVYRLVSGGGQVGLAVAVGGGHDQGGGLCTGGDRMGGVREGGKGMTREEACVFVHVNGVELVRTGSSVCKRTNKPQNPTHF